VPEILDQFEGVDDGRAHGYDLNADLCGLGVECPSRLRHEFGALAVIEEITVDAGDMDRN
jgi:hypothetical protein